ncbi:threonine synthase [Woeseia oceani]|uniref:Threonine synthase n=1 Tax=Woeseia oceani TaxID=1548547 RepID=A0A193LFZ8_9GAMM|nr:threonine synthase [Woeseia oceani]ANO51294.1 threonine synthase [Woeseia oceani]
MKFVSTRGSQSVSLDEALMQGIASDGGLFMPESLPVFAPDDFADCGTIQQTAVKVLAPFFDGSSLHASLAEIVAETYSFPIPVRTLQEGERRVAMLELFHGPTAAFKDVGAGFLAACLSRLSGGHQQPLTILVATSGDTGGAVAAAFDGRPGIRVAVLFPEGRVSPRQEKQLTCWGKNVLSLAVKGAFDDCQRLVKEAFVDAALASTFRFSSANSINIGRLLPQSIYYVHASLQHYRETGRRPSFVIPTGNLGNGLACILARDMGFPIGQIVLAVNENRLIADYLAGAEWLPRTSLQTLASAMDVGNPSNMERLRALHGDAADLQQRISAYAVSDEQISAEIKRNYAEFGIATCPHTATATSAWRSLDAERRATEDWVLVSTAHAAKFETIVEPLIETSVEVPAALSAILARPSNAVSMNPNLAALAAALKAGFQVDAADTSGDK